MLKRDKCTARCQVKVDLTVATLDNTSGLQRGFTAGLEMFHLNRIIKETPKKPLEQD